MIKDKPIKNKKAKKKKSKAASLAICILTLINLTLALVLKIRERKEIIKFVNDEENVKVLHLAQKETKDI